MFCFFFFKQKTAYEMRISDWSSDVCSSDLIDILAIEGLLDIIGDPTREPLKLGGHQCAYTAGLAAFTGLVAALARAARDGDGEIVEDRQSVVSGKSVSVRVDLGGRRTITKKQIQQHN